ncbi:hypothetical protein HED60_12325 [Planctomycetales bacterium ZRK34]|nr:hypothetical protein HED60_12325 [Planctomycetales bacterium ZRK34]
MPVPLVAAAAWVVPGLGHVLIGEHRRGVIVGVTLLSLFIGGLLVGGVDVIDRRQDTLWFAGQALIGPLALVVDQVHSYFDADGSPAPPQAGQPMPAYEVSVGRVNELGTLYCTLAGVLNLLVILDVIGRCTQPAEPAESQSSDERLAAQENARS